MERAVLLWILAFVLPNGSRGIEEWDVLSQGEMRAPTGMPSPLYFPARVSRKVDVDRGALLYREEEYPFAMVADLDLKSRHPQRFEWTSYLRKGRLVRVTRGEQHASHFVLKWDETLPLNTHTATKNRSMELSELVQFNGLLLGFCDITGIAFKIVHEGPTKGSTYVRHAIADGDGDFPKAMKAEWATVKDGSLWVGSPGLEWRLPTGKILHRNPEWVKTISVDGRIENINWRPVYQALRSFTNTSAPGYLWHEAVHWDPLGRRWIFLPRKASTRIPYTPADDERQGSNVLIVSSEHFQHMRAVEIGPVEPEWGFTAVRKLPGSEDTFMALKVREVGDETSTKLCVFDLQGRFLTDPPFISVDDNIKYEGLEFPTPKDLYSL